MKTFLLTLVLGCQILASQKTLQLDGQTTSPDASITDVAWIAGHWRGEGLGGTTEEIWSPPLGGSMMFVFKLVKNNEVVFYEIGHIRQVDQTLVLQLKHFDSDLKGWEAKNETVDFKLVKIEKDRVFFEGFTFERTNANEMGLYVVIGKGETAKEATFSFKRY